MSQWARSGVIGIARRKARSQNQGVEGPIVTQPRAADTGFVLLDSHAFRNAMNVLVARARSLFSILVIRPEQRDGTLALGETILGQLRGSSGDLIGYLDGAIAVALHATDHVGAVAFADRVRDAWRRLGRGELSIDIAEHPFAEQRVIELLTTDWSVGPWGTVVIDERTEGLDQPRRADGDEIRAGFAERQ
ncbi:MAG: hypothetical protein ACJ796_15475 [Gemmatimonadaceae bacterium]